MPLPSPIVVAGAGLAGLTVVQELRRAGCTAPVVLLGQEAEHPYDRPPLSKEALRDDAGPAWLRAPEAYPELDVDLRLGCRAVGLDAPARTLLTGAGPLPYGALVLAPGAAPRTLPGPEVRTLRTHADAVALRAALLRGGALVVVGAGPLGLEVAASARALDVEVDVVEQLSGPMARLLGPQVGARVTALHARHGVRLHTGVGVAEVRDGEIALTDGRVLPAPVVLAALGVRPATAWLEGAVDLAQDGGVLCGPAGRTSAPDVWAVGDAASWAGRRREHWTSAVDQAGAVAQDLLGRPAPEPALPYAWSEQHGVLLQTIGEVTPDDEVEVHALGDGLVALHGDGVLRGVVVLDAKKQVGRARRLLRDGADLGAAREALLR